MSTGYACDMRNVRVEGIEFSDQFCARINIVSTRFSTKSTRGYIYRATNRELVEILLDNIL